jgi:Tfp pilus assembly protein PilX
MKTPATKTQQQGFVSIFTVLIIMTILTLVAIGFSNITRQAQKRTLDNQLNTQAFYAAESGVNEAKKALLINPTISKTSCQGTVPLAPTTFTNYVLDAGLNTGYTCVLIKPAVDLVFDSVTTEGAGSPKTGTIESTTGAFGSFDISWTGPSGVAVPIPNPTGTYPNILETSAVWGGNLGMLRVDLVPIDGALDRATLATKSYGFYIYPSRNSTWVTLGASSGTPAVAGLIYAKCAAAVSPCKATIVLTGTSSSKYYVRVQSVYNPVSSVVIDNFKNSGGTALVTKSGQTVVDSTGRANDVLRRIQVRLKEAGSDNFSSGFAIQSGASICKRLQVGPPDNVTATTTDQADSACQTNN